MLQRMDRELLMTFEDHEIVAVTLMVPEEKVLAVNRIDFLPIFQSKLDGRKRRMSMELIAEAMLLKEGQDLGYTCVIYHLFRLLA